MRPILLSFFLGLLPLSPSNATEFPVAERLVEMASPGAVLLLGEVHHHPESTTLFGDLVERTLAKYGCVAAGLEIAADQQERMDAAMRGESDIEAVAVHPAIDHPGFRALLRRLQQQIAGGACLEVRAVDAPQGAQVTRDRHIADRLAADRNGRPVLALLGSLHTLQRVEWSPEVSRPEPFAGGVLKSEGVPVRSVIQRWSETCEGQRIPRLWEAKSEEALEMLRAVLASSNVILPARADGVVDGAVLWGCP
jgi:hypothetical protein